MRQANAQLLPYRAGTNSASIRRPVRPKAKAVDRALNPGVLGYPVTWPAGPWVVPLFWLLAVLGAWLLHWLG